MNFPEWMMANGEALQYALLFALFPLLVVLERAFPRRPGDMDRRTRWSANLILTVINIVSLGFVPITFLGAAFWAEQHGWGLLHMLSPSAAVAVVVTLLVRGFISFFTHYLMHSVPLFWRLHRVHHLDTDLDVSTTVRLHPVEFFANSLIGAPIVVLFGLSPWVLVLYEVFDLVIVFWSHANVRIPATLHRVLRYLIVTPDLHRVHHSSWQPETDSNFSAVFPIWDLVFGTYRATPRDGHERMRIGLDEVRGAIAHRPLWLLMSPLRRKLESPPAAGQ